MPKIMCPKCGEEIDIEKTEYMKIVEDVRTKEFKKEIDEFKTQYDGKQTIEKDKEISDLKNEYESQLSAKDNEIDKLSNQIKIEKDNKDLEISKAVSDYKIKVSQLEAEIEIDKSGHETELSNLKTMHEKELKLKDEEIQHYKDFKAKQSTKMIGESLERFCEEEFNKVRATGFQTAYFAKDNDSSGGSKGDYIFRDNENGVEYVSIMFEMKNEADETATKHKNTDFLKKLDEDRRKKKCEFAVLVSTLEADNEYYNTGIVDVSYEYEKMYVIRPQFLIPMITLIRNMARNNIQYRMEVEQMKNENMDYAKFQENFNKFKMKFGGNVEKARDYFAKTRDAIEKAIKDLEKVRDNLDATEKNLRLADNKLEDMSIKKLTRGAPLIKKKFDEAKNSGEADMDAELSEKEE